MVLPAFYPPSLARWGTTFLVRWPRARWGRWPLTSWGTCCTWTTDSTLPRTPQMYVRPSTGAQSKWGLHQGLSWTGAQSKWGPGQGHRVSGALNRGKEYFIKISSFKGLPLHRAVRDCPLMGSKGLPLHRAVRDCPLIGSKGLPLHLAVRLYLFIELWGLASWTIETFYSRGESF